MRVSVGDYLKCSTSKGNDFRLMYIGKYNNKMICYCLRCPEHLEEQTNLYLEFTSEQIRKQFPYIEKEIANVVQKRARERMARKYMEKYKERKEKSAGRKTICNWD